MFRYSIDSFSPPSVINGNGSLTHFWTDALKTLATIILYDGFKGSSMAIEYYIIYKKTGRAAIFYAPGEKIE